MTDEVPRGYSMFLGEARIRLHEQGHVSMVFDDSVDADRVARHLALRGVTIRRYGACIMLPLGNVKED